jgi:CheY-like chemotaxis protein
MPQLSSILLVDDDETANFLSRMVLQRAGVTEQVLVAENGQQALRVLETSCTPNNPQCPDLILLDVNMPVMNGLEFLVAYQQLPLSHQQGIVIVLLTSTSLPRDVAQLMGLPVAGMVEKPLTADKFQRLLAEFFPA